MNLAGAEFGDSNLPGCHGANYLYPDPAYAFGYNSLSYYSSKGMTAYRLPFRWERLQPVLDQPFDSEELARLQTTVRRITDSGAFVVIDPHNYARYYGKLIGSEVANEQFADLWGRLATEFLDNDKVIFGLMNNPHSMATEQWVSAANAALKAIRDKDAKQLVLVPGNNRTEADSWTSSDYGTSNALAMTGVVDPGNNFAFEVHQYLDSDGSGTHEACASATRGSEALREVTEWLRCNGKKAFLAEFGASSQETCLSATDDMLNHIERNADVWLGWTWWAGGPWWGAYFMSLEPNVGQDRPQMNILQKHLGLHSVPDDAPCR